MQIDAKNFLQKQASPFDLLILEIVKIWNKQNDIER